MIRRHVIVVVIVHGEKSTPFLYTQNTPHTKRIYIVVRPIPFLSLFRGNLAYSFVGYLATAMQAMHCF